MYFCIIKLIKIDIVLRKFFIVTVIAVLSILLFNDCANTGTPSGGEKDTLAPVVKKMNPENLSTDFEEKKIRVIFNEFVQLNEMEKNMYVSPPLKEKPEITTKGKGIQIKISDTLKPNTTYSINFGEAIGDYTENNPISNFRYVFSTGENIDSLWLLGQINNSWTLLPEEKIFIGLYKNLNDSAPFLGKPDFLSKSDKDGLFNFSYIHEGVFRLFALKDNNSNLTYEAGEDIAFFNQIIKIDTSGFKLLDNDLNPIEYKDTSGAILPDYNIFESHSYIDNVLKHAELLRLNLFMEDKEHQFILEDKRDKENKILLKFNSSHKDELKIALIDSVYAPPVCRE